MKRRAARWGPSFARRSGSGATDLPAASPCAIPSAYSMARRASSGPASSFSRSVMPSRNSLSRNGAPSWVPMSWMARMLGWFSAAMVRASCSNRRSRLRPAPAPPAARSWRRRVRAGQNSLTHPTPLEQSHSTTPAPARSGTGGARCIRAWTPRPHRNSPAAIAIRALLSLPGWRSLAPSRLRNQILRPGSVL